MVMVHLFIEIAEIQVKQRFRWGWHCWLTYTFCVCDLPGQTLKKLITDRSILLNDKI